MSTQAEQAALGYFWAWLKAKTADDIVVRDFGAIGNGEGGINCVRVKVRDTILTITPWPDHRHVIEPTPAAAAVAAAVDTRLAEAMAEDSGQPTPVLEVARPSYGGAERYACPSCGARRWDWCMTKTGKKSFRPHSAREHMVS